MAIHLGTTDRVDCGALPTSGLTEISILLTWIADNPLVGTSFVSKWGTTAQRPILVQNNGSNQLDFLVASATDVIRQVRTVSVIIAGGAVNRLVFRWRASDQLMAVTNNGSHASLTGILGGSPASLGGDTFAWQYGSQTSESKNAGAGAYAEAAVFRRFITDDEAVAYGKGVSPELLGSSSRLSYLKLMRTTLLNDLWRGTTATLTGGTQADHPGMIYAASARAIRRSTPAQVHRLMRIESTTWRGSWRGAQRASR